MTNNLILVRYLVLNEYNKFRRKSFIDKCKSALISFFFFCALLGLFTAVYIRGAILFRKYGETLYFLLLRIQLLTLFIMAAFTHSLLALRQLKDSSHVKIANMLPLTIFNRLLNKGLVFLYESKVFFVFLFYLLISSLFITQKVSFLSVSLLTISFFITYCLYTALILILKVFVFKISTKLFSRTVVVFSMFGAIIFFVILLGKSFYFPVSLHSKFLENYLEFIYYLPSSWMINIVSGVISLNLYFLIKYAAILLVVTGVIFAMLYFLEKKGRLPDEGSLSRNSVFSDKTRKTYVLTKILGKQKAALYKKDFMSIHRNPVFYVVFLILTIVFIFAGRSFNTIIGKELVHPIYVLYIITVAFIFCTFFERNITQPYFEKELNLIKPLPISAYNYISMKLLNNVVSSFLLSFVVIVTTSILLSFSISQTINYVVLVLLLIIIISLLSMSLFIVNFKNSIMTIMFKQLVILVLFLVSFIIFKMIISYTYIYLFFFPFWLILGAICFTNSIKKFERQLIET